ncbi:Calcineurin metallo-phosphoesterase superfamily protein [Trifolium repens]|nr:Calcineurin metallo-phosphoesterase superfamily protein [Trifolium repens]
MAASSFSSSSVRIVVVGDVHDYWNFEQDSKALQFLKPDLVLFTGDFGEENLEVVRSVANIEFAKAVILGNHDCWYTKRFSDSEKDKVQLQLECLGKEHVAYQRLDLPLIKVSIVGGRPFSCGGKPLFRKKLLSARYGIKDMDGSAKRIQKAALGAPEDHFLILLAHNGPTGLGSDLNDICGKDWELDGSGDHGDPDLECAISLLKENNQVSIPLVVFGHMHKELAHGNGFRKMIVVGTDNTIYLNGAIVPRVKSLGDDNKRSLDDESPLSSLEAKGTARAFTLVELSNGRVTRVAESWVSVVEDRTTLKEEQILFEGN